MLLGEGYQDDVTYDQLPGEAMDELRLPDGPLGKPRLMAFAVRNHHATNHFRWGCGRAGGQVN